MSKILHSFWSEFIHKLIFHIHLWNKKIMNSYLNLPRWRKRGERDHTDSVLVQNQFTRIHISDFWHIVKALNVEYCYHYRWILHQTVTVKSIFFSSTDFVCQMQKLTGSIKFGGMIPVVSLPDFVTDIGTCGLRSCILTSKSNCCWWNLLW